MICPYTFPSAANVAVVIAFSANLVAVRMLTHIAPEVTREQGLHLLTQAGGQLRVAIVMAKLNIDRDGAVAKLSAANNSLRDVIG